ncbi:MAG TPA: hypothetical protein VMH41_07950, partial [Mycobacteriales bacterium]|nr:hypothetical protein [Mycobacteriales bacterium]
AVKALLAAERFPEIFGGSPAEGTTFQSASGQLTGLLVGLKFVEPALSVTAPYVLGSACARAGGVIAVLFGEPVDGRVGVTPTSLLEMASDESFARDRVSPWVSPVAGQVEIDRWWRWYIERLDKLFAELVDPRPFASADSMYLPSEHLAFLLSVERLFTNLANGLAYTAVNDYLTKVLSFSALDCLEELPGHPNRTELLRPSKIRASLDVAQRDLPPSLTPILERVLSVPDALQLVVEGFFAPGVRRPGEVLVTQKSGQKAWVSEDLAIGRYLNLVRNGTHGYAGIVGRPADEDLLLTHDGNLPREVGDIALAHVLRLVADPVLALGRTLS